MQKEAGGKSKQEFRLFTDSTGQHKTEAKFIKLSDGKILLLKKGGSFASLPMDRLSKDDQQYVLDQLEKE